MKFSLIICTLGERIDEFKRLLNSLEIQSYKEFEIIVVTQDNHDKIGSVLGLSNLDSIHLQTNIRGLSRARNLGLEIASGDIITISDDDCWYKEDSLSRIAHHLSNESNDFDVFCFRIYDPYAKLPYKNYKEKGRQLTIKDIGSCSSIEIFYINSNKTKLLRFDEKFGLGAIYPSGEENIFLGDLLDKGCKIKYIPEYVVYHRVKKINEKTFDSIKMRTVFYMFKRIFGQFRGVFIYFLFFVKHFPKIENKRKAILLIFGLVKGN